MSGGLDWSQAESEILVKVPVDGTVGKDRISVKIEPTVLTVRAAGAVVFGKELAGKVVVDESYWSLEGSGADRCVIVTLCKKKGAQWRTLTKEEEEKLPQADVLDDQFDVMNLEHDDDDPERVEEQQENERKLEARYKKLRDEKGLEDEVTLQTFFALFDNCIQLYRLNKLSDYLEEIVPVCRKRTDKYKLKAIQALAFVRWKQSKFREALPLFHEMEDILGKGAALCENIAHTYNSLGDYEKAEEYFRQSLRFIEQEHGANSGNRGGVLLGLGLVRDRLGKHREALPVCTKAYEFYKERANGAPASLQAKAGISCAKLHAKLGDFVKAESYIREAVQMYEVTCGETSPLTASAYHELGKCLWKQRKRIEAQNALKRAYEIESMKDAWDLVTLLEIHNLLMDTHLKESTQIDRAKFEEYFKVVDYVVGRVQKELPQDGNAAVYYKAAAELKAWGGKYAESKQLFERAIPLLQAERSTDCSGLIKSCTEMLAFCGRNLQGTQHSPMDFSVPAEVQAADKREVEAEPAKDQGVVIEELDEDEGVVDTAGVEAVAAAAAPGYEPLPGECEGYEYQPLGKEDGPGWVQLCASSRHESVFVDQVAFARHLQGAGQGLCWAARRRGGGVLEGVAVCGSDGVFGHLLELVVPESLPEAVRSDLVGRCAGSCRGRGLRAMRCALPAGSESGTRLEQMGWFASSVVYELDLPGWRVEVDAAGGGAAASASAATPLAGAEREPSRLRRDGEDMGTYYNSWDALNVDKVLAQEDGGDASIVPDRRPDREDFGENRPLDVSSRIAKYSWDQSEKFVSVYISWDGAKALPEDSIEVFFRPRGVLLIISANAGKPSWFKVPNLCQEIDTEASKKSIKTDTVILKLRKRQSNEWSDLTDEKDKAKKRREYRIQHGDLKDATTEQLLADMYQNATDEERAGLRDAMRVNREKRAEDAKAAAEAAGR